MRAKDYSGFQCPEFAEPTRELVWRAISETGTRQLVAAQYAQMKGWTCSQKQASTRVSQYLNPRDPHPLPADFMLLALTITGRLRELRALTHEAEELADAFEHKRMAKVSPGEAADERRRA